MGGFFGAVSSNDCVQDVFFGTDYHSHLGTRRGGITAFSPERGFQRGLHSIENSPFRTKFEKDMDSMRGNICIGCISDTDPQPMLIRSALGTYAICTVGVVNNADELIEKGRILVNNKPAITGAKVDKNDKVCYNGKIRPSRADFYFLFYAFIGSDFISRHIQFCSRVLFTNLRQCLQHIMQSL